MDAALKGKIAIISGAGRGLPEDLLGAAVFLASDASHMVTGQLLMVDGGAAFV